MTALCNPDQTAQRGLLANILPCTDHGARHDWGKKKGILKTQDAQSIKSQSEALPLLRRLVISLRLFLLLFLLFRLHRPGLRPLLFLRRTFFRRRRSALGLRTLARRGSL